MRAAVPGLDLHGRSDVETELLEHDPRLSRIFGNKVIRIYPAFKDFYGLEEPIEQVVSHFRHAAQGLEEKKQILYLLGPVGGGKSSIAERLNAADDPWSGLGRHHHGLAPLRERLQRITRDGER